MTPILIDLARAYLTIQGSPSSCERFLVDKGHNDGGRRKHVQESLTEVLLMIRRYVTSQIGNIEAQSSFPSSLAPMFKELAGKIRAEI